MPITVPYTELAISGGGECDDRGGSATRKFKCSYADAPKLCTELRGSFFNPPDKHPFFPYLYCRRASFEGLGRTSNNAGVIWFPKAIVTASYEPLDFLEPNQPPDSPLTVYLREDRDTSARMVTPEDGAFKWDGGPDNGKALEQPPGIVLPQTSYTLSIFRWFNAPVSDGTFEKNVGKVNDGTFRALWTSWDDQTLLFLGARSSRELTQDGFSAWQVTLSFSYDPHGWNKVRHKSGTYYPVKDGGSNPPYDKVKFTKFLP